MLRTITALLLLAAFTTQTFERALLMLDYYVNTASFAQNCQNKFRPQMHCNGQCVLMKKIKEQENKEQRSQERKVTDQSEVLSTASFYTFPKLFSVPTGSFHYYSYTQSPLLKMPRSIFHPPNA